MKIQSLLDFNVIPKSDPIPAQDFCTTWGVSSRPELLKLIQHRVTELVEGMDISNRDMLATADELTLPDDVRWFVVPHDVEATDVDCSKMQLAGRSRSHAIPLYSSLSYSILLYSIVLYSDVNNVILSLRQFFSCRDSCY